jgi:hypothetical protein
MKQSVKYLIAVFVCYGSVAAGTYIVPKEYDNVYNSNKSKKFALISNKLTTLSSATKTLAGKDVHYRCVSVSKIDCRAATPDVTAVVSDVVLMKPGSDEIVPIYATDLLVEDAGNSWRICGAAIGAIVWDDAKLHETKTKTGKKITLTYKPLVNNETYRFFTDDANRGSDKSYMTIELQQVCK